MRLVFAFSVGTALFATPDSGKTLFETKCASCHALPEPQSLNDRQWGAVLGTMQQRLREAGKPVLTEAELKKLRCYLNTEAGRPCRD